MVMIMRLSLPRWLRPQKFPDEERTRVATLLNLFIWSIVGILIINKAILFIANPQIDYTFRNYAVFILLALALRWLMWQGRVYLAGFGLCLALWSVVTYYVLTNGRLDSPVLLDFGVTVLMATILLGARG